jgi:hypothetical protein
MMIQEQLLAAVGERRGAGAADRICHACLTLRGVVAAAISLVYDGTNIGTLGASSAAARTYDELQFTLGEGPCLDSVTHRAPVVVTDLADPSQVRWPLYGPALLAHRIHAVTAMPIVVAGEYVGALDLFRTRPGRLDDEEWAAALMAAELAQLPLLDVLDDDLQSAATDPDSTAWTHLHTLARAEVGQASGMLIAQLNIGPADALMRLRAHAYATGVSATETARDIIDRRLRLDAD